MRKILISLLLASVAASPAFAGSFDGSDQHKAKESHQQAQQSRPQNVQQARPERLAERPSQAPEQGRPRGQFQQQVREESPNGGQRFAPANRGNFAGQYNGYNYYPGRQRAVAEPNAEQQRGFQSEQRGEMQQQRMQERELRQSNRPAPNVMRAPHQLPVSNVPRPGTQPPLRVVGQGAPEAHWNTGWRNDNRYDWQDYRRYHRSIFHLGFYYDPYGWGYSPFQIGWRLWPGYYDSQYWISDPWMYRLPFAPPGYVWVRYWNDAVLVDTFSGTVVDVIPGFFW